MAEGPQPYPVVYDAGSGAIQYVFQSGQITIPEASPNAITALTGAVTASGPGSAVATIPLTSADILVGNGSNHGVGVAVSGDATLANTGALTVISAGGGTGAFSAGTITCQQITPTSNPLIFKPNTDTNHVVQFQTSGGASILNVDTINQRIGIGTAGPNALLDVNGPANFDGNIQVFGSAVIGAATASIHASAILDAESTTRGFLPPQMTSTQKFLISSPATGLQVYDTTNQYLSIYNGTNWMNFIPFYAVQTPPSGTITPDASQGTEFDINISGDVTVNGPTNGFGGQKLTFKIVSDSSHSVTLATGANNFNFGSTVPSYTNTASKTDYVGVIYNSASNKWDVVSASLGF